MIEVEASFVKRLLRFGPVGFIVGYSLTITGFAFVLWNLLMACTNAGLSSIWKGPFAHLTYDLWPAIYVGSLIYAVIQWIKQRRTLTGEPSDG